MNHRAGSEDFMQIMNLIQEADTDNMQGDMSEIIDIYWQ